MRDRLEGKYIKTGLKRKLALLVMIVSIASMVIVLISL